MSNSLADVDASLGRWRRVAVDLLRLVVVVVELHYMIQLYQHDLRLPFEYFTSIVCNRVPATTQIEDYNRQLSNKNKIV